ncbi:endonuclease domain-containing protein [Microlunatus soli]|uniref:endonuclease domain-containing protein n=1 Tax=Microlunatus soli TaxID=630515 RepID=UPI0012FA1F3C|nr:DUF559 domain-containing protein [Microlunatus soli]
MRAAMVIFPNAFASHSSAALIWGGDPPYDDRTHISVLAGETRSRRRGIAAHLATDEDGVRTKNGIRLSSPERSLCELATEGADLVALVVLGDSLVRAEVTTPEKLIAVADSWPHRRAAVASRAARLVREGVESSMESRLRMLIVLAGLPEPTVNVIMRHPNGEWKWRFDLCYRDLKLLIEYDGEHHALDPEQRARDLERREELEHQGWRIVVIQKQHIYRTPGRVLERICVAREDCSADPRSCRTRTTWRNYNFAG